MTTLDGKVAIITGAASGIGRAGAKLFAAAGARLVLVDLDRERLDEVAREVGAGPTAVQALCGDVTSPDDWQRAVDLAINTCGGLDVLWNNAAITGPGALTGDLPLADWQRVLAVNLTGVFLGVQAVLPAMLGQRRGSIVNTSSVASQVVFAGDVAYCAAKAGVVMLTRTAAVEYAKQGVRVNCLLPGLVDTPLFDRLPHLKARVPKLVPLGRTAAPEEVARCALFLASDDAAYVTGEAFVVDGGYTLR